MQTCILLSARRFDFKGEDDKQVTGMNLTYLSGDVEESPDNRGAAPMTISAPVELFGQLGPLPGIYDMDFKQRPGRNGRPTLHCVGVKFRESLDALLGSIA